MNTFSAGLDVATENLCHVIPCVPFLSLLQEQCENFAA